MPSSLAALLHGTLAAVGMCPARCACSCGRWAGASSRPAYSSGLRTSTRFWVPIAATTSSRKARIEASCSVAVYDVASRLGRSDGQLAGVELPLLAAAVEELDVLVAVELEVPVGVGREPVVVAAVQHDGVVVGDAATREELLELGLADEVTTHLVLQVGRPVELDRALDVALVVRSGVLVDLDQHHLRVVEVVRHPLGGDKGVLAGHVSTFLVRRGRGAGVWGQTRRDEEVQLAAEAEPEDRVEQRGHAARSRRRSGRPGPRRR